MRLKFPTVLVFAHPLVEAKKTDPKFRIKYTGPLWKESTNAPSSNMRKS